MIFLLHGSDNELVSAGIQNILFILRNPTIDSTFIYQWAKGKSGNWQDFLIETLCIVQSYHITEKLHLDKKQLEEVYWPYRCGTSLYINPFIKCLYLMAERLLQKETDHLITYMRDKSASNFSNVKNDNEYLELYLLDWIRQGHLQVHAVDQPKIGLLYEFLKEFEITDALEPLECIKARVKLEAGNKVTDHVSAILCEEAENSNDSYKVLRETCGYVLIINQKVFTKPNPENIPPNVQIEENLGVRMGTDADCKALSSAFSARGYKIVQRDNLTHVQIQKALIDIVEASVVYDSLIVCILSHGNKGVIFGSDYIPVNITTIQEILSSKQLLNKPKVLIIQACQGREKNVTISSGNSTKPNINQIETDGVVLQNSAPKYADLLTAMSTIEGFVSIRDRELGTWYINEVCNTIEARGDFEHMLDLLTYVNNQVSKKRHKENEQELCMLPEFSVRLLKKMYLPKKR